MFPELMKGQPALVPIFFKSDKIGVKCLCWFEQQIFLFVPLFVWFEEGGGGWMH